jgi:hypothetical protein
MSWFADEEEELAVVSRKSVTTMLVFGLRSLAG